MNDPVCHDMLKNIYHDIPQSFQEKPGAFMAFFNILMGLVFEGGGLLIEATLLDEIAGEILFAGLSS